MKKLRPKVTQHLDARAEISKMCLTLEAILTFTFSYATKYSIFLWHRLFELGVSSFLVASATHRFPQIAKNLLLLLMFWNGLIALSGQLWKCRSC